VQLLSNEILSTTFLNELRNAHLMGALQFVAPGADNGNTNGISPFDQDRLCGQDPI
jgi:hypothetical protein